MRHMTTCQTGFLLYNNQLQFTTPLYICILMVIIFFNYFAQVFFSCRISAAWINHSQSKSNKIISTWCTVFIINLHRNKDEAWICQTEWWSARVKHSRGEQILYGSNTVRNTIVCAPLKSCSVQNWVFSCVHAVDVTCVYALHVFLEKLMSLTQW